MTINSEFIKKIGSMYSEENSKQKDCITPLYNKQERRQLFSKSRMESRGIAFVKQRIKTAEIKKC
jgi:hypothetical protein